MINIRDEVVSNIDQLKRAIESHEGGARAGTAILSMIRRRPETLEIPYLNSLMLLMDYNWSYDPATGSIKSAIESGGNLIREGSIRPYVLSFEDRVKDVNETTLGYKRI